MSSNKNMWLTIGAWFALYGLLTVGFSVQMPFEFAALRAFCMISSVSVLHYLNQALLKQTIEKGNHQYYFFGLLFLMLLFAIWHFSLDTKILPAEAQTKALKKIKFRPLLYFSSSLLVVFLSTITLVFSYLQKRENHFLQIINSHNEARLQLLQSQINPHFLFNAMNNIYSLAVTKSTKASEMLLQLTELLRYTVYQKPHEKISVNDDAKQIEFLIRLFSLRNDEPYNIVFKKEISGGMIEPMILLPLVENCLKHCDFDLNENAFVKINLFTDTQKILFTTENTYNSIQVKPNSSGVGLKNIRERLELIYGNHFQLLVSERGNIFNIILQIEWRT